jgi:23S rRNA (pseudouridine1915-N3)-methyltransferase
MDTKGGNSVKFSDTNQEDWLGLSPYIDTCLLPLTGLSGKEQPWEATQELEKLRDAIDLVEVPYKGRMLIYPAFHYIGDRRGSAEGVNEVCRNLKAGGFKYVVIVTARSELSRLQPVEADAFIALDPEDKPEALKEAVTQSITGLWRPKE